MGLVSGFHWQWVQSLWFWQRACCRRRLMKASDAWSLRIALPAAALFRLCCCADARKTTSGAMWDPNAWVALLWFRVCVQAASTPDALSLPYIAILPFFAVVDTRRPRPRFVDACIYVSWTKRLMSKKVVIVVKDVQISFSSGQVLLALATHLLLWSIAFDKKTCLFAVTVSVMFQHIRTCRHSGSWASSCFIFFIFLHVLFLFLSFPLHSVSFSTFTSGSQLMSFHFRLMFISFSLPVPFMFVSFHVHFLFMFLSNPGPSCSVQFSIIVLSFSPCFRCMFRLFSCHYFFVLFSLHIPSYLSSIFLSCQLSLSAKALKRSHNPQKHFFMFRVPSCLILDGARFRSSFLSCCFHFSVLLLFFMFLSLSFHCPVVFPSSSLMVLSFVSHFNSRCQLIQRNEATTPKSMFYVPCCFHFPPCSFHLPFMFLSLAFHCPFVFHSSYFHVPFIFLSFSIHFPFIFLKLSFHFRSFLFLLSHFPFFLSHFLCCAMAWYATDTRDFAVSRPAGTWSDPRIPLRTIFHIAFFAASGFKFGHQSNMLWKYSKRHPSGPFRCIYAANNETWEKINMLPTGILVKPGLVLRFQINI